MPRLANNPVHLGRGGTASVEPPLDGAAWFAAYAERHSADGADGRLVTQYRFSESWSDWEVHPGGAELVICVGGGLTLVQQSGDGSCRRIELRAGDYAINPAGVWHTADVESGGQADCIFITAGEGTMHRRR